MKSANYYEVSVSDIERYEADGVVCLRGVLDPSRIAELEDAMEDVLAHPGPQARAGKFAYDTFMWTRNQAFWKLQADSAIPSITAQLMRSSVSHLMADVMFAKEQNTPDPTPWHQDQPYGWYDGTQVCSVWIPLDRVTLESGALEYVRGSHRAGIWYRPVGFTTGENENTDEFAPMPDIEANRADYDIVHFDLEPGDALFHNLLVLHGAPGNSSSDRRRRAIAFRYAGDDAKYAVRSVGPKPIWDPGIRHGDRFGCDLFPQVWPSTGNVPRFWERPSS
ncbi:phytanoyl-CoA dioxygenase family protein [Bradyrhizobium sp. NP1]|uniref:phytanoyl-CoA dioxygenase family protein n=1 Tax=Bradyrhizobium sp. NP1 TaxID=3049772 RepID=UPI0025A4F1F4|nr:phytanoyl-CoA dioxygenase family protein [Bradyrhizobium sp. NP1]WJR79213.1 phytanoyl-CoA dioxygenase family protein [Bradyrhizobium sp. NP1]